MFWANCSNRLFHKWHITRKSPSSPEITRIHTPVYPMQCAAWAGPFHWSPGRWCNFLVRLSDHSLVTGTGCCHFPVLLFQAVIVQVTPTLDGTPVINASLRVAQEGKCRWALFIETDIQQPARKPLSAYYLCTVTQDGTSNLDRWFLP